MTFPLFHSLTFPARRRATLGCWIAICLFATGHSRAEDWSFSAGEWTLRLAPSGDIVSLADRSGRQCVRAAAGDNLVRVGLVRPGRPADEAIIACATPEKAERAADGAAFEYAPRQDLPLRVRYEVRLTLSPGTGLPTLTRSVTLTPSAPPLREDVLLVVGNTIAPPGSDHRIFTPRYDGIGEEVKNTPDRRFLWWLNGGVHTPRPHTPPAATAPASAPARRTDTAIALAIPMVSDAAGGAALRATHIADPLFATCFGIPDAASPGSGQFNCIYQGTRAPVLAPEERTFWTVLHGGGPEEAVRAWYATALESVPAGPEWLHDVAWQHYDYLSHGGKGWFEDIDALEPLIPRAERSRIVLTIHGWYDLIGRYAFDERTGRLDDEWTAFPNAAEMRPKGFPTSESVKMTRAETHRRIRYAKERGFRVCVYFGDGLAACDGAKDVFAADRVLQWGGWVGPDTIGKTYLQNPAHPAVCARYVNYLKALLTEYGDEIDALVWDETFHARTNAVAPGEPPAYAARAMMRLVRDCTLTVSRMRPRVAFLTSDCAGATFDGKTYWLDVPPYAIMAHGTYQDTHCRPEAWPYGIFPNLRNVLWSCNWQAVTRFDYTAFAVENYRTPVATSNGWLDDKGIARLTPEQRDAVIALFNKRKPHRQELRWLTGPPPVFKP